MKKHEREEIKEKVRRKKKVDLLVSVAPVPGFYQFEGEKRIEKKQDKVK